MAHNNSKTNYLKKIRQDKGFTIIGVLVAGVIGLIVVGGLSQMMVHLSTSLKQIKNESKQVMFMDKIWTKLKQAGCHKTLSQKWPNQNIIEETYIVKGDPANFKKIFYDPDLNYSAYDTADANYDANDRSTWLYKDADYNTLPADIDLDEREDLSRKYGLSTDANTDAKFTITCSETSPNDCDCQTGPFPCTKKWELQLVYQTEVSGALIYNSFVTFDIDTTFTRANSTAPIIFQGCSVVSRTSGRGGIDLDQIKQYLREFIYADNDLALVGQGTTTKNADGSALKNTAIGKDAGKGSSSGDKNVFIGYKAGAKTTRGNNTFVGYEAGSNNNTGNNNVFIGSKAGKANTAGKWNIFLGTNSANSNNSEQNVFIGHWTGYNNTGQDNVFIGHQAGRAMSGNNNTSVGFKAGIGMPGGNNIAIGYEAGQGITSGNNHFVIGNQARNKWIVGKIGTTDLSVEGKKVCLEDGTNCHPSSSRTLKKNIKSFKNFKQALDDILKTSLFTYQYRDKEKYNPKKRIGVISEELPKSLQIKEKGKVSRPDWSSIYGTFWGAIKALYEMIKNTGQELKQTNKNLSQEVKRIEKELTEKTDQKIKSLSQEVKELKLKLEDAQKELNDLKKKDLQ